MAKNASGGNIPDHPQGPDGKEKEPAGRLPISRVSSKGYDQGDIGRSEGPGDLACAPSKKTAYGEHGTTHESFSGRKVRRIRDLSCGEMRIYLEVEIHRVRCRRCGKVKQEKFP